MIAASALAFSVCAGLSAGLCSLNIWLYIRVPRLGRHSRPGMLVFYRTCCDLAYSLTGCVLYAVEMERTSCGFVSWLLQFWWAGSNLWVIATVFEMLFLVRNPFDPRRHERKLTLAVWATATLMSVLPAYYQDLQGDSESVCWVLRQSVAAGKQDWTLYYIPFGSIMLLALVLWYLITRRLNEVTTLGIRVQLGEIREIRQTRRYLIGYLAYWLITLIVLVTVRYAGGRGSFTLHTTVPRPLGALSCARSLGCEARLGL